MRWEQLLLSRLPFHDVVVIHLGWNDLARKGRRWLLNAMRADLMKVADRVKPAKVIRSEVVPRFKWRGAEVHTAVERSRCKLNFAMRKACNGMGWGFERHGLVTLKVPAYYEKDGVHLTGTGLAMFMLNIADALEQAGCT